MQRTLRVANGVLTSRLGIPWTRKKFLIKISKYLHKFMYSLAVMSWMSMVSKKHLESVQCRGKVCGERVSRSIEWGWEDREKKKNYTPKIWQCYAIHLSHIYTRYFPYKNNIENIFGVNLIKWATRTKWRRVNWINSIHKRYKPAVADATTATANCCCSQFQPFESIRIYSR